MRGRQGDARRVLGDGDELLGTVEYSFTGLPRGQCEQDGDRLDLGVPFAPVGAADGRHQDADLALRPAEHLGQLRRDPNGVWVEDQTVGAGRRPRARRHASRAARAGWPACGTCPRTPCRGRANGLAQLPLRILKWVADVRCRLRHPPGRRCRPAARLRDSGAAPAPARSAARIRRAARRSPPRPRPRVTCHVRVGGRHRDDRLADVATVRWPGRGWSRKTGPYQGSMPARRPGPRPSGRAHARDAFGAQRHQRSGSGRARRCFDAAAHGASREGQAARERQLAGDPFAGVDDPAGAAMAGPRGQDGPRSSSARRRDDADSTMSTSGVRASGPSTRRLASTWATTIHGPRLGRDAAWSAVATLFGRRHLTICPAGMPQARATAGKSVRLSAGRGDQAAAGAIDAVVDGQHVRLGGAYRAIVVKTGSSAISEPSPSMATTRWYGAPRAIPRHIAVA